MNCVIELVAEPNRKELFQVVVIDCSSLVGYTLGEKKAKQTRTIKKPQPNPKPQNNKTKQTSKKNLLHCLQ